MKLLCVVLSLVLSTTVHGTTSPPQPAARALRPLMQATRDSVVYREKWADILRPRQAVASPGGDCDNADCPPGYTCGQAPPGTAYSCSCNPTSRRRSTSEEGNFINAHAFHGGFLSAAEVAKLILGDGQWLHTNGSLAIDYAYKVHSQLFRDHALKRRNAHTGMLRRARNSVIKYTAKNLAWRVVTAFKDPAKVLVISENYAAKNYDVVRIAKELLSYPDWEEVLFWDHTIPRPALEGIVEMICPRMGPEYCDPEATLEDHDL